METQTETPAVVAPPVFEGGPPRIKSVSLRYPVRYDGKLYDAVTVRRLTVAETAAFESRVATQLKADPASRVRWPVYYDSAGNPLPDVVIDALDADDKWEVDKIVADFLPRAWLAAGEVGAMSPATGASTEPSSDASRAGVSPS